MQADSNAIFEAAQQLSDDDRWSLISRLLASVPETTVGLSLDDEGLKAELDRRSRDLEGAVSWEQLRHEL